MPNTPFDNCALSDPTVGQVIAEGWPRNCRRCGARWPMRCGVCGACIGRAKAQARRLGAGDPKPGIREVKYHGPVARPKGGVKGD